MVTKLALSLKNTPEEENGKQFIYFPLILVFCYFFGICRRFVNLFSCDNTYCDSYVLFVLMKLAMPMQGVLNGIYYGLITKENRRYFISLFTGIEEKEEERDESDPNSIELEKDFR
jgi:hypothetical protein